MDKTIFGIILTKSISMHLMEKSKYQKTNVIELPPRKANTIIDLSLLNRIEKSRQEILEVLKIMKHFDA